MLNDQNPEQWVHSPKNKRKGGRKEKKEAVREGEREERRKENLSQSSQNERSNVSKWTLSPYISPKVKIPFKPTNNGKRISVFPY